MKNQTIIFKNLFSGIGLFILFFILSGYELKAESLSPSEKKYGSSKKIAEQNAAKKLIDKIYNL